MFLNRTWLGKIWQTDKLLFGMVVLYCTGILYYTLKQHEEFPFLLYGMYSLKEKPQNTYTTYEYKIGGKEIRYDKLWDLEHELIASPVIHAVPLFESGTLNKEQTKQLQAWLFRYVGDMRLIEDNTLQVYKLTCAYNKAGKPKILKREMILSYDAN